MFVGKLLTPSAVADCLLSDNWYALLDGVLIENLLVKLAETDIPYYCLFKADVPEAYKRIAPYLVKCEAREGFLDGVIKTLPKHYASFLRYHGDAEALSQCFQGMVHAKLPDERVGVLRFQDSRIMNVLFPSLAPPQVPFVWPQGVEEYLLYSEGEKYTSWVASASHSLEFRAQKAITPFFLSLDQMNALSDDYYARLIGQLVNKHKDSFSGSPTELAELLDTVLIQGMDCGFAYPSQLDEYVDTVSKIGWLHEDMQTNVLAILRKKDLNASMKLSLISNENTCTLGGEYVEATA